MKTIIKILVIFLFGNYGFSQIYYSHYLDNTSEWRYYRNDYNIFTGEANEYYTTYYFDEFEIINNYVYYKRYANELKITTNTGSSTSQSSVYSTGYVREDSDGKFYYYDFVNNTDYIAFDNQLVIDAQVDNLFPNYTENCYVHYINYIDIENMTLKKINGTLDGGINGSMEGVGNVGNHCSMSFEGGDTHLHCYKKQNTEIQFGNLDCSIFPIPNRINLSSDFYSFNKYIISPNPAKNNLTIISKQNTKIASVSIYTILGQLVLTNINPTETIDVSGLQAGNYFIKIVSDSGITNSKFIKE